MNEILMEAIEQAMKMIDHSDPLKLGHYRWLVKNVHSLRKRIRTGMSERTGKPLKSITLKSYKRELRYYEKSMKAEKLAIKMLIDQGCLDNKKLKPNVISLAHYRAKKGMADRPGHQKQDRR